MTHRFDAVKIRRGRRRLAFLTATGGRKIPRVVERIVRVASSFEEAEAIDRADLARLSLEEAGVGGRTASEDLVR